MLIANVQNFRSLIGREEYNINRIVLLTSILYSLTKKQQHSNSMEQKNRNLLIKNKLIIIISQKLSLYKLISYYLSINLN